MVIKRLIVSMLATAALATPALSFAQSERGSITGVVEDTTKAAIPGVSVSVINTATNATTHVVSSESGTYSAANLPPGTYRIEASLTGFRSAKIDGVRLTAGATARADITLNLGAHRIESHLAIEIAGKLSVRVARRPPERPRLGDGRSAIDQLHQRHIDAVVERGQPFLDRHGMKAREEILRMRLERVVVQQNRPRREARLRVIRRLHRR